MGGGGGEGKGGRGRNRGEEESFWMLGVDRVGQAHKPVHGSFGIGAYVEVRDRGVRGRLGMNRVGQEGAILLLSSLGGEGGGRVGEGGEEGRRGEGGGGRRRGQGGGRVERESWEGL